MFHVNMKLLSLWRLDLTFRFNLKIIAATTALSLCATTLNGVTAQASTFEGRMLEDRATQNIDLSSFGGEDPGDVLVEDSGNTINYVVDEEGLSANVVTRLLDDGSLTVEVHGKWDGQEVFEVFDVESLTFTGNSDEDFVVTLEGQHTHQEIVLDSEAATTQAIPAIVVLGFLARVGLRVALNKFGKSQIKKAAKSYILKQNANKWSHIMAPKHCWGKVGARSKEQVADLMGRAMAEGNHMPYKRGSKKAVLAYKGRQVVVTYAENGGYISDGWVEQIRGKC